MKIQFHIYYLKHKVYFLIRKHRFPLTEATKSHIHSYQYKQTTAVKYIDREIKVYTPAECKGLWYVLSVLPSGASGVELTHRLF